MSNTTDALPDAQVTHTHTQYCKATVSQSIQTRTNTVHKNKRKKITVSSLTQKNCTKYSEKHSNFQKLFLVQKCLFSGVVSTASLFFFLVSAYPFSALPHYYVPSGPVNCKFFQLMIAYIVLKMQSRSALFSSENIRFLGSCSSDILLTGPVNLSGE